MFRADDAPAQREPLGRALLLAIVPSLAAILATEAAQGVRAWLKREHKARLAARRKSDT